MAQRITYRRKCSYATRGNRIRKVKTPGASWFFFIIEPKGYKLYRVPSTPRELKKKL